MYDRLRSQKLNEEEDDEENDGKIEANNRMKMETKMKRKNII